MNYKILAATTIVAQMLTVSSFSKSFTQQQEVTKKIDFFYSDEVIQATKQKLEHLKNQLDIMSEYVFSKKGIKILRTELEKSDHEKFQDYGRVNVSYRVDLQGSNGVVQLKSEKIEMNVIIFEDSVTTPGTDAVYNDLGEIVEEAKPGEEVISHSLSFLLYSANKLLKLGILVNPNTNKQVTNLFMDYQIESEEMKKVDQKFDQDFEMAKGLSFGMSFQYVMYGDVDYSIAKAIKTTYSELEKNIDLYRAWNRAGYLNFLLISEMERMIPLQP